MKVRDPQGRTWRVSRRWLPWRRRVRMPDWLDGHFPTGDDPISAAIGMVLLVVFVIPWLIWFLVLLAEQLLRLLVLPFTLIGRLFGLPWPVEVRDGWQFAWETEAGDWGQSERVMHDVAEILRRGDRPWGYYS